MKKDQNNRKNKRGIMALLVLLLLVFVGATFAWFSENAEFVNAFKTGTYETEITENFTSPTNWRPGMETPKEIFVANKGDVPVAVRVKFSDAWYNENAEVQGNLSVFTYKSVAEGKEAAEAAIKNFDMENCITDENAISAGEKWFVYYENIEVDGINISVPREAYYLKKLENGDETSRLLKSVTMNQNITADRKGEVVVIKENGQVVGQKVVTETKSPYAGTKYELTIIAETVQADKAAVLEVWEDAFGENGTLGEEVGNKIIASLQLE